MVMKKFFTLMLLSVFAIAAQAKISIYVKCETAPFIWSWGAANGVDLNVGDWPGTNQLTEKFTHPDTGEEFWVWTFEDASLPISFLFNNGEAAGTKQTKDINGVSTDRYFILSWDDGDGNVVLEDVTEDYGVEIPDASVTKVTLAGNHNGWNGDNQEFAVIEAGKKFQLSVDLTNAEIEENLWKFKFRPNAQDWCGYWDVYYWVDPEGEGTQPEEGKVPQTEAPAWLSEDEGNFMVDLENEAVTSKIFTFIITWNGGKEAGKNWSFYIENGVTEGITNVNTELNKNAAIYNLAGQRINANFRGVAIQNGKKIMMK